MMEGLSIRRATPDDTERIAEIIHGVPGQEATAIAGCEEAAREFGMAMVRTPGSGFGWENSVVAQAGGWVIGVLQPGTGGDFKITPSLALLALRILGVSVIAALPRLRARMRVDVEHPEDAYQIAELHVDSSFRNRGIGGALLGYAEKDARAGGFANMSLSTTTINPARHLYERHGFRVIETRTDAAYERYTGIAGRHLMVKELV
jgi:ribosomal protein S18 acetylase RimI-like enzyme